jgi:hypothetical protein
MAAHGLEELSGFLDGHWLGGGELLRLFDADEFLRRCARTLRRCRSPKISIRSGDLSADGHHEAFGEAVRSWTPGWDLDHLDAGIGQHRVERCRELSSPVADEEPEPGGVVAEVHDEVAGLLGGPGAVRVSGHAQDVQGAVADLEREQDVEPPQRHRAVDVEEVDREHGGGLGAQELPPAGVGVADRCRWDPVAPKDPTDR